MVRMIALLPDIRAQKRLAAALALRKHAWSPLLVVAAGWGETHALALGTAPALLVFDPYNDGLFNDEPVLAFAEQFRSCVLFGYAAFPRGCARDVLQLSRAGVHAVATQDLDDAPHAFAALLDGALESGTVGHARLLLEQHTPAALRTVLPRLLFRGAVSLKPAEVAGLCHCHPKTLRVYLRNSGLPSLGKLITWARLVRACHLLQDGGRSVENVALVLGFASANNFRNQLMRYAGVCPTAVRGSGTSLAVLSRFQAALQEGNRAQTCSAACDPLPAQCAP
jgi:AraC-like DNA-binding protein